MLVQNSYFRLFYVYLEPIAFLVLAEVAEKGANNGLITRVTLNGNAALTRNLCRIKS